MGRENAKIDARGQKVRCCARLNESRAWGARRQKSPRSERGGKGGVKKGKEEEKEEGRRKPAAGAKILFLGHFQASWGDGVLENGLPASGSTGG